jgi:hypothetical protein
MLLWKIDRSKAPEEIVIVERLFSCSNTPPGRGGRKITKIGAMVAGAYPHNI